MTRNLIREGREYTLKFGARVVLEGDGLETEVVHIDLCIAKHLRTRKVQILCATFFLATLRHCQAKIHLTQSVYFYHVFSMIILLLEVLLTS